MKPKGNASRRLLSASVFFAVSLLAITILASAGSVIIKNGGLNVSSNLYVDPTTGMVGIGTTSPTATLHISSTNPAGALNIINTTTGASLLFVNATTGSVGIGTTSPSGVKLDIRDDSLDSIGVGNSTTQYGKLSYGTVVNGITLRGATNKTVTLGANNSNHLFIDTSGNVGIGTTSPGSKLEVNAQNSSVAIGSTLGNPPIAQTGLQFLNYGTKHVAFRYDGLGNLTYESAGNSANPMLWYDTGVANFIVRNGNVGIGTVIPGVYQNVQAKLEVKGANAHTGIAVDGGGAGVASSLFLLKNGAPQWQWQTRNEIDTPINRLILFDNATNQVLTVLQGGNVGIGTTNPVDKLDVYTSGGTGAVYLNTPTGTQTNVIVAQTSGGTGYFYVYQPANDVTAYSLPATAIVYLGKSTSSGRSLNAVGTVNANGADYAEWIPWTGEKPEPGTIIDYKGSKVVVSSPQTAAFTGNDKYDINKSILISFTGQVPVKVVGKVNEGDYIIPNSDGAGRAVSPDRITFAQYKTAIGTAWETSNIETAKKINVAVGIK